MGKKKVIIAIDGPSGAGKSTVSKLLALKLGISYVDTGALYRIVALEALKAKIELDDDQALACICSRLDVSFWHTGNANWKILSQGKNITLPIRMPEISSLASKISAKKAVRDGLLELQQKMGENGGVVMEGRDVGTVVFPDSPVKFFLDATLEVRGKRRHIELAETIGSDINLKEVTGKIKKRDSDDSSRKLAPLKMAEDAIVIDSSEMGVEEVVARMLKVIEEKT